MVEVGIGYCKEREGEVCDGSGGGEGLRVISQLILRFWIFHCI